jgi:hypothetical protein
MQVRVPVIPAAIERTRFPPELFTVSVPVLLLTTVKTLPNCSVLVTGRVTVCVVDPVKTWRLFDAAVSVVVLAAVAVVV